MIVVSRLVVGLIFFAILTLFARGRYVPRFCPACQTGSELLPACSRFSCPGHRTPFQRPASRAWKITRRPRTTSGDGASVGTTTAT